MFRGIAVISHTISKPRLELAQVHLIGESKAHRKAPASGVCPNRVKDLTTVLLVPDLAVLSLLMVLMATNKVDVEQAALVAAAATLPHEGEPSGRVNFCSPHDLVLQ